MSGARAAALAALGGFLGVALLLDLWGALGFPGRRCPACGRGRVRWGGYHNCIAAWGGSGRPRAATGDGPTGDSHADIEDLRAKLAGETEALRQDWLRPRCQGCASTDCPGIAGTVSACPAWQEAEARNARGEYLPAYPLQGFDVVKVAGRPPRAAPIPTPRSMSWIWFGDRKRPEGDQDGQ